MYTSEHLVLELLHYQLFCSFVNTCMDIDLHSLKIITLSKYQVSSILYSYKRMETNCCL